MITGEVFGQETFANANRRLHRMEDRRFSSLMFAFCPSVLAGRFLH